MKRIVKLLFSQSAFIILALLLQVGFFLSSGMRIMSDQNYAILNGFLRSLSVVLMVHIVNGRGNPET